MEERQLYLDKLAQKPALKRPPMVPIMSIHVADNRVNMNIDRKLVVQKTGRFFSSVYDTRILDPRLKEKEYTSPLIVPPNMNQFIPELELDEGEKVVEGEEKEKEVVEEEDKEAEAEEEKEEVEEEDKEAEEEVREEKEEVVNEEKQEVEEVREEKVSKPYETVQRTRRAIPQSKTLRPANVGKAVPVNPETYKTMEINGRKIEDRLPKPEKFQIKTSDFYMSNRKLYTQKLAELFSEYNAEILKENETVTCDNRSAGGKETQLFIHQRVVRDYLNLHTPYRGLLLLHGLGSGKTATSIAIAEGMKTEKRVFVLTPASLKMNFFSELKKYGDPLYKKNQFWEFVSINGMPQYVDMLASVLSLSPEFVKRNGGAWMVDVSKQTANFKDLDTAQQKQLDDQLNQMIRAKYVDINYNGLNKNKMRELVTKYGENPFHDAVILVDEAHNLVSRISNKLKKTAAPTSGEVEEVVEQLSGGEIALQLYRWIMEANNARVVFMSGTPMINYPNEIGIMFNMLRGYIKTWTIQVTPPSGFAKEQMYSILNSANFRTYDYIDYSNGKITVTRNPFGFLNDFSSGKRMLGGNSMLGGNMLGGNSMLGGNMLGGNMLGGNMLGGNMLGGNMLGGNSMLGGEGEDTGINIAVIIPYRDSGSLNRSKHLAKISVELPKLFNKYISKHSEQKLSYNIIVVEQSNDGNKFNRGKLLNIGYEIALEKGANVFIFHDVDLIPSEDLIEYYFKIPEDGKPIHIAKVWGRYSKNPKYLGGITSFNQTMYENMNGFPNNFWGWGGEDDELYKRVNEFGYKPIAPTHGTITDLEGITLEQKLDYLRANADELKNMKKWELLEEHDKTWKTNGLADLQYKVKKNTETKETHVHKITVDIGKENNNMVMQTNRKNPPVPVPENGAGAAAEKKNRREDQKPYDPNAKYVGVRLSEQGNISDKTFIDTFLSILENNGFAVNKKIDTMYHKCLPDTKDEFNKWFVDIDTVTLKNVNVLKKRILGLTSYFRSAQESLLPTFVKNKEGGIYHIEQCEMSHYQLGEYEKVRKEEADAERKRAERQRKQKPGTEDAEAASAYRIFSRLMCNFVFPAEIEHPKPPSARKINELAPDQIIEQVENRKDETADHEDIADDATLPDLSAEYQKEIQEALAKLNTTMVSLGGDSTRDVHVLSPESLEIHSPKFLRILNNLRDEKNEGCHLIYSNFRTMEGIGILKQVLEHNGYAEFKLAKTGSGDWSIVDSGEESKSKPKFVLYTGTETAEEKEVIRNVYNSNWDLLPAALAAQLREIHPNNHRGEIIRVLMITAAGAEGINLENTRFVHIVEPYWNLVRIEQVVGRARRICSHKNLPPDMRTVQVFLYMTAFSKEQIESKNNIEIMTRDVGRLDGKPITTDQYLYQLASLKDNLTSQILGAIKSTAIDCALYAKNNKENLVCYGFGNVKTNDFGTFPTLEKDAQEKEDMNVEKQVLKPKKLDIPGQGAFAYIPGETTAYDLAAYLNSKQLVPVGRISGEGNNRKVILN